jgi:hypothetical protein
LKKKKSLNRTEKRTRNRKKRNMNRLIIMMESFGPAKMNEKERAMKSDVTLTKMLEWVERRRRGGGQIRNAKHS